MEVKNSNSKLTNGYNNNFEDGNYSPVELGKGELARKFQKFSLLELTDLREGNYPKKLYLRTKSGNIYSVHDSAVFVSKNLWIYDLPKARQDEIMTADIVLVNSQERRLQLIDLSVSDGCIQTGLPFKFSCHGKNGNTSEIIEIIGDSEAYTSEATGVVNNIKIKLIENLK